MLLPECHSGKNEEKNKINKKHDRMKTSPFLCQLTQQNCTAAVSKLLSRIIYCNSLFIPLSQFINNNYRLKSQKHLQSIQSYYTHTHTHTTIRD